MFDLRQYWEEIREMEASLPQYLWIVDAAGVLIEVTARIAAKLLHAKSHRVAEEHEIELHRERESLLRRGAERTDRIRRGVDVVAVPAKNQRSS
jgi:hypothetical protein